MLRVVIDTNVLVSAIIRPGGTTEAILRRWQSRQFALVSCRQAIGELDAVLRRPSIAAKYRIRDEQRENLLALILERVILVPGDSVTGVVTADPKDDMFIACAVEGEAKYIISGDRHLLDLRCYRAIRVVTAAYFLHVLDRCRQRFGFA